MIHECAHQMAHITHHFEIYEINIAVVSECERALLSTRSHWDRQRVEL